MSQLYLFPQTALYEMVKADNLLLKPNWDFYTLYDYDYIDPRVKRLAEKMDIVNSIMSESMFFHYKSIIRLLIFTSRMHRSIIKMGEAGSALLGEYRIMEAVLDELLETSNMINHEWFLNCLDWAEKDGTDSVFFDLLYSHLDKIKQCVEPAQRVQFRHGFILQKALHKLSIH